MSDIQTELSELTDQRLDYVMARSKVNSDAAGFRDAGIGKTTFYSWDSKEREKLNSLANRIKHETAFQAMMILQSATEKAAQAKVEALDSRDPRIKQAVATEILDRVIGKATSTVQVTGANGGAIVVDWDGIDSNQD